MAERQAALIAQWMNVGFIHGVMNTDNMTISGETIDYGPCAFMEAYDPAAVFSSIDDQGRYAFGNQPDIACWNLARLAETLLPLLSDDREKAIAMATEVIAEFPAQYRRHLLRGQRAKLGLRRSRTGRRRAPTPRWSTTGWRCFTPSASISRSRWRRLADAAAGDEAPLRALFADAHAPDAWLARWRARCASETSVRSMAHGNRGNSSAPRRCAASIPTSSPATIASKKRWPPRPTTVISRPSSDCWLPSAAVRRDARARRLRRAGAGRRDRVLPNVLRHLNTA